MKETQQTEETGRRLTWTISEGIYWCLKAQAAKTRVSLREALESAIAAATTSVGTFLVPAKCPACEAAIQVSTSGRTYLGGPGSHTPKLSDATIVVAEAFEALKERNPSAAEAVEALVRSL